MKNFNKFTICPTRALQKLVIRRVRQGKTKYNYAVAFLDTSGFGLSLATVDWLPEGQRYVSDIKDGPF